jgi:hypothetical protein
VGGVSVLVAAVLLVFVPVLAFTGVGEVAAAS